MDSHPTNNQPRKRHPWVLRTSVVVAVVAVVGVFFFVLYRMSSSQLRTGIGPSRCPTQNQKDIASRNDDPDRYVPPSHATGRPVVFTPFKDSEILEYDFLRSRMPVENVMSFSLAAPSPVIANEIQVAFIGNLVRADHQAVFPIAKYPPSQAYIVPWIRPDGRVVEFHVCIDPLQPSEPPPGSYSGTIAWSTRAISTADQPLVASGQAPVTIRLQYRQQHWVWIWGLLAIMAGVAIKLFNDDQGPSASGHGEPMDQAAHRVGLSTKWTLWISIAVSVVVGGAALVRGYYGNPEFAADLGGDLWTLAAAVFAATVAAHATVGALHPSRDSQRELTSASREGPDRADE